MLYDLPARPSVTVFGPARHVDSAARGRSRLRLQAPSGAETDGDGPAATSQYGPVDVGACRQLRTGQRWENLTTPARPSPTRKAAP